MVEEMHERVAKVEERLDSHLNICDIGRKENNAAHIEIKGMVKVISGRMWWVMGLIIGGFSAAAWTMASFIKDHMASMSNW
jgi:hypothetical protein